MVLGAFLLGFGLGGFLDGIILHQILQWHHIISNLIPMNTLTGLQKNAVGDGIFSMGMWLVAVRGFGVLWQNIQQKRSLISTQKLLGWIVAGWGGFNIFDSIVFHWLLRLHHIRQVPNFLVYDIATASNIYFVTPSSFVLIPMANIFSPIVPLKKLLLKLNVTVPMMLKNMPNLFSYGNG